MSVSISHLKNDQLTATNNWTMSISHVKNDQSATANNWSKLDIIAQNMNGTISVTRSGARNFLMGGVSCLMRG